MSLYHELSTGWKNNENKTAIICDEKRYTYAEFRKAVQEIAEALKESGIMKGCKIAIMHEHPLQFVLFFCALVYMEAIPIPVYSQTGAEKLNKLIEHYEINSLIISEECAQNSVPKNVIPQCKIQDVKVYCCNYTIDPEIEDTSLMLFTSGTTSIPKAVMLSETNIISNVEAISNYLKLTENDRILLVKDLSHSSSIVGELLVGLHNNCTIVLCSRILTPNTIMKLISGERISVFFAVPTLLESIMAYPKLRNEQLDNIRILNFYGASMHEHEIEQLYRFFKYANVIYSYGQTEASPRVTYIEKKDLLRKRGSCGRPIEGVSVTVVDENGNKVPANVCGEITVSGPNVMIGYYKDPQRTNKAIRNGVLFTGDIGYMDEDGYLYVTGRKDNMLISSGKNIYPEEIEGVLSSYKDIVEALVMGKPKGNGVLDLVAYIVSKPTSVVDFRELFEFCKRNLEFYKIPKDITIVEKLKKTPSGKIIRSAVPL